MNLKKLMGVLVAAPLLFWGCESTASASAEDSEPIVRNSIAVRDSVRFVDSVKVINSINFVDSVRFVDSVNVVDSVHIIDSLNIVDSAVHVIDSVVIRDSLRINIKDSVRIIDSIVVYGPEHYFGACTAENSGVIKSATINDEVRDFVCDKSTLFWRIATKVDWNDKFIYESHAVEFTDIKKLVDNLAATEKMILVLRHAERGSDYSMTGPLNEAGFKQSEELGESIANDMEFYYGASQFVRAHQTCNSIAKGRGDLDTLADTLAALNDNWYVKDEAAYKAAKDAHGGGWKVTSEWAFEGAYSDAFYNLNSRSTELFEEHLIPAFENSGKQVGLFVSHDVVMVPLVVYASEKNIDLKYYKSTENHWLNYLGGVAIVFKPDGTRVFYVVKGLDSGTM
jgi:broad specificity phosphatase PhoE